MAEQISAELARELIRDGNTDRLNADPHAVDKLNQSVIEEFRANQGRVGGPLEKWPILLLTMTGAKTGPDAGAAGVLFSRWRSNSNHRLPGWSAAQSALVLQFGC
jgi:F420H(2)-dependent quinone reductase